MPQPHGVVSLGTEPLLRWPCAVTLRAEIQDPQEYNFDDINDLSLFSFLRR